MDNDNITLGTAEITIDWIIFSFRDIMYENNNFSQTKEKQKHVCQL